MPQGYRFVTPSGVLYTLKLNIKGRGEIIMGSNIDEIVIGLLKSIAFCVIIAGVMAAPVQLLHSPGLHTYLPTATYS